MIYILNSPVLTAYGLWRFSGPLTPKAAREKLAEQPVQSAIGHAATAILLSELLEHEVKVQRQAVTFTPGDAALVFRLKARPPEGVVFNLEELRALPYELAWLEYLGPGMEMSA